MEPPMSQIYSAADQVLESWQRICIRQLAGHPYIFDQKVSLPYISDQNNNGYLPDTSSTKNAAAAELFPSHLSRISTKFDSIASNVTAAESS